MWRVGVRYCDAMGREGWTEQQLQAMSPEERQMRFEEGFVFDLRDVSPEQARAAVDRIRISLSKS